jgi:hypothetical protein
MGTPANPKSTKKVADAQDMTPIGMPRSTTMASR